jgi:eukaryotic-like serine/threonine-protein kinase
LAVRLRLPSAVTIQSLSRQQVQYYVDQAGTSLAGLRTVLQRDESLWELLNTPLMLSIVALAYQGRTADEIRSSGTVEAHRTQLLAAYTDTMFHRRAKATPYTREQTEHWLTWLARAMKDHSQTIFYLEWIQPDWLPVQRQQRLVTFVTSVMSGLLFGLLGGLPSPGKLSVAVQEQADSVLSGSEPGRLLYMLLMGLFGGLSVGIRNPLVGVLLGGLLFGLLYGLSGGLLFGLLHGLLGGLFGGLSVTLVGYCKEIKPVEKIRWSWSAARYKWINHLFKRLLVGLSFGLSFGLVLVPLARGPRGLVFGLVGGLVFGLLGGLLGGLKDGFTEGEIRTQSFPNEGIRRSVLNASIRGLVGGLLVGLVAGLPVVLIFGLLHGLLGGLLDGLRFGGRACLHHFALRLVLWHKNFAPLHYVRFLDYATARIFLRKVGGGYVFAHRMLLEYFAVRHQPSTEQQNCNKNG